MRLSILMAVMHVMGRLGLWDPYLHFIQTFLDLLDDAAYEEFGPLWDEGMYDIELGEVIPVG